MHSPHLPNHSIQRMVLSSQSIQEPSRLWTSFKETTSRLSRVTTTKNHQKGSQPSSGVNSSSNHTRTDEWDNRKGQYQSRKNPTYGYLWAPHPETSFFCASYKQYWEKVSFNIEIVSFSLSYKVLPKSSEARSLMKVPLVYVGSGSVDNSSITAGAAPIKMITYSEKVILEQNYDSKQSNATLKKRDWKVTV